MKIQISSVTIECVRGDITEQVGFDAVVNAANAELRPGGGVAGAIHRAAGAALYEECRPLAPIQPGEAVITGAHGLPNRHVIHCLGPVYGVDVPSDVLVATCYDNALRLAEERGLESVAFPALSSGAFGYPLDEAARVAVRAVAEAVPGFRAVRRVRLVLRDEQSLTVHEQALAAVEDRPLRS